MDDAPTALTRMTPRSLAPLRPLATDRETSLAELTRRAMSSEAVEATIARALDLLRVHTGADSATFWDLPDTDHIRLAVASGWPSPIDGVIYPIAPDSQAAYALARDRAVVVDQEADTRFVPSALVRGMGYHTSITCRLGPVGVPRGLVSAHYRDRPVDDPALTGFPETVAGIVTLALEYHRSQEDLRFRAEHDSLTGLLNRAGLIDALDAASGRSPAPMVLVLDLDGFKAVNDTSGHHVGDAVLQCVAARLLELVRSGDVVGRLGGDEFVVIAHGCDVASARTVAERVVGAIEQLIIVDHEMFSISASVGIADATDHETGLDALRAADAAMYAAKSSGRGRVHVAAAPGGTHRTTTTPAAHGQVVRPAVTVADIDAAIDRTTVAFQPIVDAYRHRIVAVEALARGPAGTAFEDPALFFASAETFSRLNELDLAAKRAAFASGVPDALALFVNIDPAALTDDGFRQALMDAWSSSGYRGDLVVELTERSLVAAPGRLLRAIDSCREAGWRIALDDLGARAESLTALRLVRPDVAKLDLSLVDRRTAAHAASVAVAIATHRERWPLVVVAEGVETPAHEEVARDLGADLLQGFHYGRPAPLAEVLDRAGSRTGDGGITWQKAGAVAQVTRIATKRHLLGVTRAVEALAGGSESIVLAALQSSTYYTRRTRGQYAALARRCGMTGVLGVGVAPGVVNGVHHAPLAAGDPLAREWIVVVLAADGGIALAADDCGDRSVDDMDRLFEYRVTRDPEQVEAIAHRLLARF